MVYVFDSLFWSLPLSHHTAVPLKADGVAPLGRDGISGVIRKEGSTFRAVKLSAGILFAVFATACAEIPNDPIDREAFIETNDPAEPANRAVFDFDLALLDHALSPIAVAYRDNVPEVVREGMGNVLDNLQMPVTILNSGLQGDFDNMTEASVSFFINTTAGLGGLFDIPAGSGRKPRREDFGQTLAVWGVKEGPYIVLPISGPATARDAIGLGVDILTDPLTWLLTPAWSYARTGAGTIDAAADEHDRIEEARRIALDFYATVRSLYRQDRARQIANGFEDPFGFDPFEE